MVKNFLVQEMQEMPMKSGWRIVFHMCLCNATLFHVAQYSEARVHLNGKELPGLGDAGDAPKIWLEDRVSYVPL
jgi:hypothetical protein